MVWIGSLFTALRGRRLGWVGCKIRYPGYRFWYFLSSLLLLNFFLLPSSSCGTSASLAERASERHACMRIYIASCNCFNRWGYVGSVARRYDTYIHTYTYHHHYINIRMTALGLKTHMTALHYHDPHMVLTWCYTQHTLFLTPDVMVGCLSS